MDRFANTRRAIEEFDRGHPERERMFNAIVTDDQFVEWHEAEKAALIKVQEAFYEDTKDVNSRDHCEIADIGFMRECAYTLK